MNEYRYILETGSRKHICPGCNKKTFVRYIDSETGEYLPGVFGRCDRESKCSYHLNPYKEGYGKEQQGENYKIPNDWKPQQRKATNKPVFMPVEALKATLQPDRYEHNTFIQNLLKRVQYPFEANDIEKVISLYRLGTIANGYRAGAVTFPFIDIQNNIRAVQVKKFDENNHTTGTDFLHSIIEKHHTRNNKPLPEWLRLYNEQGKRVSCLFGEHLLREYPQNPVALVEAPKTAVYGTLYFGRPETPENFIWLAVYNKSSFSFDKLKALKGRFVFVFPDLSKDGNTFKEWKDKANDFEKRLPGTRFIFSDLLERLADQALKENGADIADVLINMDWRQFRNNTHQPQQSNNVVNVENAVQTKTFFSQPEPVTLVTKVTNEKNFIFSQPENSEVKNLSKPHIEKSEDWSDQIKELESYFSNTSIPTNPIKLDVCSTITNTKLFIESHIATARANNGNKTFLPYLNRLNKLKITLNT